ncbi:MAG: MDR family oxidoreductase [Nitratireductor sp.]
MSQKFKAIQVSRDEEKKQSVDVVELSEADLMDGDVTLNVEATTINYKDALAITGKGPVVRHWPMVPGIDLVGTVTSTQSNEFKAGDRVLLNGFGVGEVHWGAYAGMARLKADWLIPMPKGFTPLQAMGIGTAGYTAMLCVMALENQNVKPENGPIIVTGANGGVGSIAISILSKLGYEVHASTGRVNEAEFLKKLGASEIIDRNELSEPGRPFGKERWAGAVDSVGSHTLANVIAQTKYGGAVAACGLAQGADLPATVMPFILRGVSLLGVESVMVSKEKRIAAWNRLAQDLDVVKLDAITNTIGFDAIPQTANDLMDGKIQGRIAVDMAL